MEVLAIVALAAALASLGAAGVAVNAAGRAGRERIAAARDRDHLNRTVNYQHPRSLR